MPYSVFVAVALAIHVLIGVDMFIKKDNVPAIKSFRLFLISIAIFYITDIFWGIFESNKLSLPLYIDTFIYFVMMGTTVFFWSNFVVKYLESKRVFTSVVRTIGIMFLATEVVLLIVNIFVPILFTVDKNAHYEGGPARDIMLWIQIVMYSLLALYSIIYTFVTKIKHYRRYISISVFSMVMIVCIAIQLTNAYIPFYSIGCLVGICILATYALSDTKENYKTALQETSKIKDETQEKLGEVTSIAYSDPLTGVKSKYAYVEMEEEYDRLIAENKIDDFAIVVFDLNGLKRVNDTKGHNAGDEYIIESVKIISEFFPLDCLYRFGGDEFVAVLKGENFNNRQKFHNNFMRRIEENISNGSAPVIASGISRFKKGEDNTFNAVFYRADKMMYSRKEYLKDHN